MLLFEFSQKRGKELFLFFGEILQFRKNHLLIAQNIILLRHRIHLHFLLTMDFLDQSHFRRQIYISKVMGNFQYSGERENSVCIFPSFADNGYILIFFYEKIISSFLEYLYSCHHPYDTSRCRSCRILFLDTFFVPS